jgi:hypothetical protein
MVNKVKRFLKVKKNLFYLLCPLPRTTCELSTIRPKILTNFENLQTVMPRFCNVYLHSSSFIQLTTKDSCIFDKTLVRAIGLRLSTVEQGVLLGMPFNLYCFHILGKYFPLNESLSISVSGTLPIHMQIPSRFLKLGVIWPQCFININFHKLFLDIFYTDAWETIRTF